MALKVCIALAFAFVYIVESSVIRSKEILPAEGMVVEVIIRPNSNQVTFEDSSEKRLPRRTHDVVVPPLVTAKGEDKEKGVPEIENRFGIRGGVCPSGYVKRGGFCFPDYD